MARSTSRLEHPGAEKPFYIQYRLLDIDTRNVTLASARCFRPAHHSQPVHAVDVRVGDYHLDSSNFVSDEGFRGFLGSAGQVGIDRDYNSLRQDFGSPRIRLIKRRSTQMSFKRAFLRSLTKPPEIDDFSKTDDPVVQSRPARSSPIGRREIGKMKRAPRRSCPRNPNL